MDTIIQEPVVQSESTLSTDAPMIAHPWEDFDAVMRHANRARASGDFQRAYAFYTRAIELDPNSAPAWVGRASTTSNMDEAIVAWGYALALMPDGEARAMLGACVSEKIKQAGGEEAKSLVMLGRRLAEAGQWLWAHRLFARATEIAPSNDEAWVWRAGVSGDSAETAECLNKALEVNPRNAQARAGLQWIESKQARAPVRAVASGDATLALEEGQRVLQCGEPARAYEHFARASELDPQNVSAWFWRGSTAPTIEEALTCMDRVLALKPEDDEAKEARWWLRVRQLRERAPVRASRPPALPTSEPSAAPVPPRPRSIVPILAALVAAALVFGLIVWLVVSQYAGFLR